jgi:hypothetical protein
MHLALYPRQNSPTDFSDEPYGFLCVLCDSYHDEHLGGFSYKKHGFYPNCDARNLVERAVPLAAGSRPVSQ